MPQPAALEDITVLDLTDEKGHLMGKVLADMGAIVIKVEPPGGDPARRIGPFAGDSADPNASLHFWTYNTSKLSITLDIESTEGRSLLRRLAEQADILLESFGPGYLDALGLGYDDLSAINPRLIMTSLTGFGQTGPYRDFVTSDIVALAMGGPMNSCGYDDIPVSPPIRGSGGQGYHTGCHYGVIGALLALFHRDMTGQGQYVDASIHEALSCTTEAAMPYYFYHKVVARRQTGRHHAPMRTARTQYLTSDGYYINTFALPRNISSWNLLLDWIEANGMVEDLRDPKYREYVLARVRSGPEMEHVFELIGQFIGTMTAQEAYHGGQKLGLPWGIVRSPEETLEDPHLRDRGFFVQVEHPERGTSYTYPGAPYVLSKTPWMIRRRAPLVGEDNEAVYTGRLGLSREELTLLRGSGVI